MAERISPALVDEFLWQALSVSDARTNAGAPRSRAWFDPGLALLLAQLRPRGRTHAVRATGRQLRNVDAEGVRSSSPGLGRRGHRPVAVAGVVEGLWEGDLDQKHNPFRNVKNEVSIDLASWLAMDASRRWDHAMSEILGRWVVAGEDVD